MQMNLRTAPMNFCVTVDPRGVLTAVLDMPGRTYNVLSTQLFADLGALVGMVEGDATMRLVLFRSGKESGFLAGADLREIEAIGNRAEAERLVTTGREIFDRLERLPIPTVAAVHGPCLGGGLEFALACRYRVARDDDTTQLGLPDWSGTRRLPQRVGLAAALPVILKGRRLTAAQAAKMGLVDTVCSPPQWASGLEQFVADRLAGKPVCSPRRRMLASWGDKTRGGRWLLLQVARWRIASRSRNNPALAAAWDAIRCGLGHSAEECLARERAAFAELLFTPACRTLLARFFQRTRAKHAIHEVH